MAATFSLPGGVEETLRKELGDLDRTAKESMGLGLHRQDQIGVGFFGQCDAPLHRRLRVSFTHPSRAMRMPWMSGSRAAI